MGQHALHLPSYCKQNCIIECYCRKRSPHATEETVDTTLSHCLQMCGEITLNLETVAAGCSCLQQALERRAPFSQHPLLKHIEADVREEALADFVA